MEEPPTYESIHKANFSPIVPPSEPPEETNQNAAHTTNSFAANTFPLQATPVLVPQYQQEQISFGQMPQIFVQPPPYPAVAYQAGQEPYVVFQTQSSQQLPQVHQGPQGVVGTLDRNHSRAKVPPIGCILTETIIGMICCCWCCVFGLIGSVLACVGSYRRERNTLRCAHRMGLVNLIAGGVMWVCIIISVIIGIVVAVYAITSSFTLFSNIKIHIHCVRKSAFHNNL